MDVPEALTEFMDTIYRHAFLAATAMAAVSVPSMASSRPSGHVADPQRFQKRFSGWLRRRSVRKFSSKGISGSREPPAEGNLPEVERDLIRLATGGDDAAFYDLPVEQMCGQISARPRRSFREYPQWHETALPLAFVPGPPGGRRRASVSRASPPRPTRRPAHRDARNRVTHHIQRSIDALQIALTFRWKFYLQTPVVRNELCHRSRWASR